jgi:hypothetical protein
MPNADGQSAGEKEAQLKPEDCPADISQREFDITPDTKPPRPPTNSEHYDTWGTLIWMIAYHKFWHNDDAVWGIVDQVNFALDDAYAESAATPLDQDVRDRINWLLGMRDYYLREKAWIYLTNDLKEKNSQQRSLPYSQLFQYCHPQDDLVITPKYDVDKQHDSFFDHLSIGVGIGVGGGHQDHNGHSQGNQNGGGNNQQQPH